MLKRERGFTLIEIVLVLAIAGLIMVIVFLAVSGAQKSRRDAQRKTDLARISAALDTYAGNHEGKYPSTVEVNDPGSEFRIQYGTLEMVDPLAGQHYVVEPDFNVCDPNGPYDDHGPGYVSYVTPGLNNTQFTLRMCLEQGSLTIDQ